MTADFVLDDPNEVCVAEEAFGPTCVSFDFCSSHLGVEERSCSDPQEVPLYLQHVYI